MCDFWKLIWVTFYLWVMHVLRVLFIEFTFIYRGKWRQWWRNWLVLILLCFIYINFSRCKIISFRVNICPWMFLTWCRLLEWVCLLELVIECWLCHLLLWLCLDRIWPHLNCLYQVVITCMLWFKVSLLLCEVLPQSIVICCWWLCSRLK